MTKLQQIQRITGRQYDKAYFKPIKKAFRNSDETEGHKSKINKIT